MGGRLMGYKWIDAESIIRHNTKESLAKDNGEDEMYENMADSTRRAYSQTIKDKRKK
jgi:hypothetical protein